MQACKLLMTERGALKPRTDIRHWRIVGPMLPGTDSVSNLAGAPAYAVQAESGQAPDLMALNRRLS